MCELLFLGPKGAQGPVCPRPSHLGAGTWVGTEPLPTPWSTPSCWTPQRPQPGTCGVEHVHPGCGVGPGVQVSAAEAGQGQ